jgi:Flp pilus assembly pilin Flp
MIRWLQQLTLAHTSFHHKDGWRQQVGQTFVEYAMLLAFIAAVAVVALQLLGTNVSSVFNSVANVF